MNRSHLCPIENSICQAVLQVSASGSGHKIAKEGVCRDVLELGIVDHQFRSFTACHCRKDSGCIHQAIGDRIGKVGAAHAFHGLLDRACIEEIPYEDLCTLFPNFICPGIDLPYECSDWYSLLEQKSCNEPAGRPLLTTGSACNQYWSWHIESSFHTAWEYRSHPMDAFFFRFYFVG